jgi:hypothetical protein
MSTSESKTPEIQGPIEKPEPAKPAKQSSRKSVLALAVFALGINTAAAVYTLSPDLAVSHVNTLAELLPVQKLFDSAPAPVAVAAKEGPSPQEQHIAALQENSTLLQQNTTLLQQDSIAFASLRQSVEDGNVDVKKISGQISDEHQDVKKIAGQISVLIAKVDSIKTAMNPDVTASISNKRTGNRLSRASVRKKMVRQSAPMGPISLGGAPFTAPATTTAPQS